MPPFNFTDRAVRVAAFERWRTRWHENQKLRFLVVGGWNTLFGYLCFVVLYKMLGSHVHYLVIGVLAHVIAVINAFVAHRMIVFESRRAWFVEFVRFNLAQLFVLGCGTGALWILVSGLGLNPLAGQAVVTISMVAVSFFVHRYFSFADR